MRKRDFRIMECEESEKGKEKVDEMTDSDESTLGESTGDDYDGREIEGHSQPEEVQQPEKEKEPPTKKRKRSGFRLSTRCLFLTYPKCPVPMEEALELLKARLETITEYIVAQEDHKVCAQFSQLRL